MKPIVIVLHRQNNNRIFLDKLNLIFWGNLGKATPTLLNGPVMASSTTYLNNYGSVTLCSKLWLFIEVGHDVFNIY